MNAQLAAPVPQSEPVPTPFLEISTLTPQAADSKTPRPHGKIARLPKLLRDQLNSMLDDGLPYLRLSDSHFCSPILANRSLPSRNFSPILAISRYFSLFLAPKSSVVSSAPRSTKRKRGQASTPIVWARNFANTRWVFSPNHLNPHSHCDIAWAGALASPCSHSWQMRRRCCCPYGRRLALRSLGTRFDDSFQPFKRFNHVAIQRFNEIQFCPCQWAVL